MKIADYITNLLHEREYFHEGEKDWDDIARRVAHFVATAEETPELQKQWGNKFENLIAEQRFTPSSPTLMNADKNNPGGLGSCYIVPGPKDSTQGILKTLEECSDISRYNGGVGFNIDTLRPIGSPLKTAKGKAGGPVSFMELYNMNADVFARLNSRKAAMKVDMSIWNPSVKEFIHAKDAGNVLEKMNISVAISDKFMEAVENDSDWDLMFPDYENCLDTYNAEWDGDIDKWIEKGYPVKVYETVKAKDLFREIAESAHKRGDPGVIFSDTINLKNPNKHIGKVISTNPCAEFNSIPYSSCCLGSFNLMKYVNDAGWIDAEKFQEDIKTAVRFLDDVITVNVFPFDKIKELTQANRSIGIGMMGFADLLYKMCIPYNSERAASLALELMATITQHGLEYSHELAKEKGCYTNWKGSSWWEKGYKVRNSDITSCAPTGCSKGYTLIESATGLLRLNEIVDSSGEQWQDQDLNIVQLHGYEKSDKGFLNGEADTKIVHLNSGIDLESTHDHKYQIIRDNKLVWVRMDEIQVGDKFPAVMNACFSQDCELKGVDDTLRIPSAQRMPTFPNSMNENLAFFIGAYYANGCGDKKRIRFSMNSKKQNDIEKIRDICEEEFGFRPPTYVTGSRKTCTEISVANVKLAKWFEVNNIKKEHNGDNGIPRVIRSSSRQCRIAFLRGYMMCDGSHSGNGYYIDTVSYQTAQDIAVIARSVGQNIRIKTFVDRSGSIGDKPLYRINFLKYGSLNILFGEDKGDITKYVSLEKRRDYESAVEIIGRKDVVVDTVISIDNGRCMTYDISVPNGHCYLANGFISHNTISIISSVSSGIEPVFALCQTRETNEGHRYYIVNKQFEDKLRQLGIYSDELMEKVANNHGSCQGIAEIPKEVQEVFLVSHDLTPEEHIAIPAAVQKEISLSISKTVNLLNSATVEDVMNTYRHAHKMGLVGITVYRDGSRDTQVLYAGGKKDDGKEDSVLPRGVICKKPPNTRYEKIKLYNGCGRFIVDVGIDSSLNQITDVYVNPSGKGGCIENVRAIGILISTLIRAGVPIPEIIKKIDKNGGICSSYVAARQNGKRLSKGCSCASSICQILKETYEQLERENNGEEDHKSTSSRIEAKVIQNKPEEQPVLFTGVTGTECPECHVKAVVPDGGCTICQNCGFSHCG